MQFFLFTLARSIVGSISADGQSFCSPNLGLGLDYIVMAMAPTLSWLFPRANYFRKSTTSSIPTAMGLYRRRLRAERKSELERSA